MTSIKYNGEIGDAESYTVRTNTDDIEVILSEGKPFMRFLGEREPMEGGLVEIALGDLREDYVGRNVTNPLQEEYLTNILEAFGEPSFKEQLEAVPSLTPKQRREIRLAFRNWEGKPDKRQSKLLKQYGLEYSPSTGGNYGHIREVVNPNNRIKVSISPSDYRAGRNLATELLKVVFPKLATQPACA